MAEHRQAVGCRQELRPREEPRRHPASAHREVDQEDAGKKFLKSYEAIRPVTKAKTVRKKSTTRKTVKKKTTASNATPKRTGSRQKTAVRKK